MANETPITCLYTDLVNSTELLQRVGDERARGIFEGHRKVLREAGNESSGRELKRQGDGVMAAFGSARKALQCAIAIQRTFAERDWGNQTNNQSIRVRIGLHTGEMIQDAGDFYGRHVNLAARIANEAQGGEILVSALLRELTESAGDVAFGDEREAALKGLSGRQGVFMVAWE